MNVKQKWFALLPGSKKIQEIEIMEITARTVLIRNMASDSFARFGLQNLNDEHRYEISDVKLIEQLPDDFDADQAVQARLVKREKELGIVRTFDAMGMPT